MRFLPFLAFPFTPAGCFAEMSTRETDNLRSREQARSAIPITHRIPSNDDTQEQSSFSSL